MRLLIVGLAVLALVVAGVSTYLINTFYSEEQLQEFEKLARPKVVRVLVAAREIRPGDAISPTNVTWQTWGDQSANTLFVSVTEPADSTEESAKLIESYMGQITRVTFVPGEPITKGKLFKQEGSSFMSGLLNAGMRAVAIPTTPATAAGGFVLPGDHIDVMLTHKLAGDLSKELRRLKSKNNSSDTSRQMSVYSFTTETIVHNVRVVAVDQAHDNPEEKALVSKSVTLEVTPKQAETLITAMAMGKLSISLRSLGGTNNRASGYTTDIQVSPLMSKITGQSAPVQTKPKSNSKSQVIRIYRGGEATTQEITVR